MTREITPEMIRMLAAVAGITVAEEDEATLAAGLGDQLAALGDLASRLDLTNVDPAVAFDARWS